MIIEGGTPEIDGGLFPVKRTMGDRLRVEADIVADGHEVLAAELLFRLGVEPDWQAIPMQSQVNDRWRGEFAATELGRHGTFQDCEVRLPYIAYMGFDVLYFPPIHPIGRTHRKGKNNVPNCTPGAGGARRPPRKD